MLKIWLINFLSSIVIAFLQMTLFSYLFGYCNDCLGLRNDLFSGIDFSRNTKALGTSFDAKDASSFIGIAVFIICSVFIIREIVKKNKKTERFSLKILNVIIGIILIILMALQSLLIISITRTL